MRRLKGVIAATATPLKENLSIDLDALVQHCEWLLGEGRCDGINLLGTTGEATSFSLNQRLEVMKTIATSGLPVDRFMVGTGAAALEDAEVLTRSARELGFAGALLIPPFYYKGIGEDALTQYVHSLIRILGATDLRLYLYHFPANTGVPYTIETVRRLHELYPETVIGLKDSTGQLEFSAELAASFPNFDVFPSAEGSLGSARELGFAGCISATANLTGPFAQSAWSDASIEVRSIALQRAVELRAVISRFPLISSVKASLAMSFGRPEWLRVMPPLTRLSTLQIDQLETALQAAMQAA